jgi:hypothetical protein
MTEFNLQNRIVQLETTIKELQRRPKDIWDKFSSISTFLSGVIIGSIGIYATVTYNARQLDAQALQKDRELTVQRVQTVERFFPHLSSKDENVRKAALEAIAVLGDEPLTRKLTVRFGRRKYRLASLSHMYQAVKIIPGDESGRIRAQLDALDHLLPDNYPFSLYEFTSPTEIRKDSEVVAGAKIEGKGFYAILDFLGCAETTIETLDAYLRNAPRETEEQRLSASHLERELESARTACDDIAVNLNLEPALMTAIDFVFSGS